MEEARSELNFSDWAAIEDKAHLVEEIYQEVAEEKMPLPPYCLPTRRRSSRPPTVPPS